jgi:hypothetical protein
MHGIAVLLLAFLLFPAPVAGETYRQYICRACSGRVMRATGNADDRNSIHQCMKLHVRIDIIWGGYFHSGISFYPSLNRCRPDLSINVNRNEFFALSGEIGNAASRMLRLIDMRLFSR